MQYLVGTIIGIAVALGGITATDDGVGTTITQTVRQDTFDTFRQNVNSSLSNLNQDKIDSASTTDDLPEGFSNFYYDQERFDQDLSATTSVDSIQTLSNLTSAGSLNTVGTLTSGSTGNGFTVDLDASSLTCTDCIDISDNTNLTGGTNATLNGDAVNVDDAFLVNDADDTTTGNITATDFIASDAAATSSLDGGLSVDLSAVVSGNIDTTSVDAGDGTSSTTINKTGVTFPDGTTQTTAGGGSGTDEFNEFSATSTWTPLSTLNNKRIVSFDIDLSPPTDIGEIDVNVDGVYLDTYDAQESHQRVVKASTSISFDARTHDVGLSTGSYSGNSTSIGTETTAPNGIFFKPDGKKMYIGGSGAVYEYDLSTAWDITSQSFSVSTSTNMSVGNGLFFKEDGTKLFTLDGSGNVRQYSLTTAWDITTAKSDNVSYSVGNSDHSSLTFKHDGTKLYSGDGGSEEIDSHTLSTAWDLSTASGPTNTLSTGSGSSGDQVNALWLSQNGQKLFSYENNPDEILQYDLNDGDLSTASDSGERYASTESNGSLKGIYFRKDSIKLFSVGSDSDNVYDTDGVFWGGSAFGHIVSESP